MASRAMSRPQTVTHRELAQHFCSDWDFMLARAEANGQLVIATDGSLAVKAPGTPAASRR